MNLISFRTWLVTSSQLNLHSVFLHKINQLSKDHKEMVVLKGCPNSSILFRCNNESKYAYPAVLQVRIRARDVRKIIL